MIASLRTLTVVALAVVICTTAAACSVPDPGGDPAVSPTAEGGIAVEENLLNVEITLPASFFNGMTSEQIQAKAEESGYTAEVSPDGVVTYTIPKNVHQELMAGMETGIDDSIAETLTTEASVESITHDANFTNFRMTVDRAAFEGSLSAAFVALGLGLQAMFYQAFDGVADSDRRVVVTYIDGITGEEFGTYVLPDALE